MTTDQETRHSALVYAVRSRRLGKTLTTVYASRPVQTALCLSIGALVVALVILGLWAVPTLAWAVLG
jgi:hypothetical protein